MAAPSEHRLLLFETSGRVGQIGLGDGRAVLARRRLDQARRHARDLAPALRDLLGEQHWRSADITAVAVSRGPGSYTGLRVGIMAAKALAYALGCPVVGIETFAVSAWQAGPGGPVEVIADAQQERLYAQRFTIDPVTGFPHAETPIRVQSLPDWLAGLSGGMRVTGPGLETCSSKVPLALQVISSHWHPDLPALHLLALERLRQDEHDDLWRLEPLYVRPSSAEEQWVKLGR